MKIAIDARMIRYTGIGTYLQGLLSELPQFLADKDSITLLGDSEALSPYRDRFAIVDCRVPIYSLAEQVRLPHYLKGFNLVHFPHYSLPLGFRGRSVVTVHDILQFIFKYGNSVRRLAGWTVLRQAMKHARRVLTVSQNTRNDLINRCHVSPQKITVIPEAALPCFRPIADRAILEAARSRLGLPREFLLYVGSLREHKNVHMLIQAYLALRENKGIAQDLVLIGRLDPAYERRYRLRRYIDKRYGIHLKEGIGSEELVYCYNLAAALAHPSLYEGFGLTVLEAFACGLPVLAGRVASVPEVAADACILVNPKRLDEIEQGLYNILTNNILREELKVRGLRRASEFSWAKTAERTVAAYREALA